MALSLLFLPIPMETRMLRRVEPRSAAAGLQAQTDAVL
jgi:hypothetical protein